MSIFAYNISKINRILFQMQSSRQKAPCAYAKAGKSKPKNSTQQLKSQIQPSTRSKRSDNIYQQLMNELDLDESEYIQKLCQKNQLKLKRKQEERQKNNKHQNFKDITNIINESSQKSIKETLNEFKTPNRSKLCSKSSIKDHNAQSVKHIKRQSSKKIETSSQSSSSRQDLPSKRFFLYNLDHYIAQLNQNQIKLKGSYPTKDPLDRYQSQGERQFRRTVQIATSKPKNEPSDMVSRTKYSKLLDKLHEELLEKEALEYKLQCKDMKMAHMKQIIQQMYGEINLLKHELKEQKAERHKYSNMVEQFASKVHHIRKSKEKHYIPHHQKRNSHVPSSSSYVNEFNDFFNRTGFQEPKTAAKLHRDFEKMRDREEVSTLKKKGMHKYKISQILMEASESEQDKASIYHDSYL